MRSSVEGMYSCGGDYCPHMPKCSAPKGHKHGECNRTACSNPDARWYNPHTNAFYCKPCALKLNDELRWANLIPLRFA